MKIIKLPKAVKNSNEKIIENQIVFRFSLEVIFLIKFLVTSQGLAKLRTSELLFFCKYMNLLRTLNILLAQFSQFCQTLVGCRFIFRVSVFSLCMNSIFFITFFFLDLEVIQFKFLYLFLAFVEFS